MRVRFEENLHWLMLFAALLLFTAYFGTMYGCGYHMKYSWPNGRWIWVNNEGKP